MSKDYGPCQTWVVLGSTRKQQPNTEACSINIGIKCVVLIIFLNRKSITFFQTCAICNYIILYCFTALFQLMCKMEFSDQKYTPTMIRVHSGRVSSEFITSNIVCRIVLIGYTLAQI